MDRIDDRDSEETELAIELRAIWAKYNPQRTAEADAVMTRHQAVAELASLNERRVSAGLRPVGEHPDNLYGGQLGYAQMAYSQPPKTWRDEMDAELLSAVKRWLDPR